MKSKWVWPVVGGLIGTGAIMALYLGLVRLTSGSWEHALGLLSEDDGWLELVLSDLDGAERILRWELPIAYLTVPTKREQEWPYAYLWNI